MLLTAAAFLGNVVGYEIGRAIGPPLYERDGRVLKQKYFDQTRAFFDKHGNKALVIGRFVPFVRTFITVVAGVTRMPRRRFFLWSFVGAVLWVSSILLLGYFLGSAFPSLGENIDTAIVVILAFSVIPIAYEWWRHRRTSSPPPPTRTATAAPTATSWGSTSTELRGLDSARPPGRDQSRPPAAERAASRSALVSTGPHLEAHVGERVLPRRAAVDGAHHDLDHGAGVT